MNKGLLIEILNMIVEIQKEKKYSENKYLHCGMKLKGGLNN